MDLLDGIVAREQARGWRLAAWLIGCLIGGVGVWAYFAQIDERAIALGEVVPVGDVKVIQHLEGGVVREIFVAEGSAVSAGDKLVQIELAATAVNADELRIRIDGLKLTRGRLAAEVAGKSLTLPAAEAARHPDLAEAERQAFRTRRTERAAVVQALEQQIRQRGLQVEELEASLAALRVDLGLARQNLEMAKDLARDKLMSQMELLASEREVKRLEGMISTVGPSIPRAKAALSEARQRLREARLKAEREGRVALTEVEPELQRVRSLLRNAEAQDLRTVLRSPIDGIIKSLRVQTIGGVVAPGEPIMEIVPAGGYLVIEAKLNPADRGVVAVGQPARAKISAYEFVRYGALDGAITRIAADSSPAPDGTRYFEIAMTPERSYLGDDPDLLPISPGMTATVEVHTGTRSMLNYLLKPVLKLKDEAFRER